MTDLSTLLSRVESGSGADRGPREAGALLMTDEEVEVVARAWAWTMGSRQEQRSHLRFYQSWAGVADFVNAVWPDYIEPARSAITALDAFRKEKVG